MNELIDNSYIVKSIEDHDDAVDRRRAEAARQIQRVWRRRNAAKAKYMNADARWQSAAIHAKLKIGRKAAENDRNGVRERWKRSVFVAKQLQGGNKMLSKAESCESGLPSEKYLEEQHWLELVDGKHRYGSNCFSVKWYHRRWQKEDTTENFFKWLDQGAGNTLTLDECPRDKLEKERITYLSAEQQLNYLVKIDSEGKLRWARNAELVDTGAGHWKDAGGGQGIVPQQDVSASDDLPPPRNSFGSQPGGTVTADPDSIQEETNATIHYAGGDKGQCRWTKLVKRHFTLNSLVDRLLRKTVRRNTWIYVSDKNGNIFIGIKVTGTFQHSSLIAGGVVTSAGLISVKDGVIHTLSPLSGHYRTSVKNFHEFIDFLQSRNVDMSKAHISKAEIALWGVEHIKIAQKAKSKAVQTGKTKVKSTAHTIVNVVTPDSGPTWKKDILEGRQKKLNNMKVADGNIAKAGESQQVEATE